MSTATHSRTKGAIVPLKITPAERKSLEAIRDNANGGKRAMACAILDRDGGETERAVAAKHGVSKGTIARWLREFREKRLAIFEPKAKPSA